LGNGLQIHCNQQYLATHIGSSGSSLTSGMTGSYNNNIIYWKHSAKLQTREKFTITTGWLND
jgi:hypothetical protein